MESSALDCRGREEKGKEGCACPSAIRRELSWNRLKRFLWAPRVSAFGRSQTRHEEGTSVLNDKKRYWVTRSYKRIRVFFTSLLASQVTFFLHKAWSVTFLPGTSSLWPVSSQIPIIFTTLCHIRLCIGMVSKTHMNQELNKNPTISQFFKKGQGEGITFVTLGQTD